MTSKHQKTWNLFGLGLFEMRGMRGKHSLLEEVQFKKKDERNFHPRNRLQFYNRLISLIDFWRTEGEGEIRYINDQTFIFITY